MKLMLSSSLFTRGWLFVFISIALPIILLKVYFVDILSIYSFEQIGVIGLRCIIFLVLWAGLGAASILIRRHSSQQLSRWNFVSVYISYSILSIVPAILFGIWLFSCPYVHTKTFIIFAASSLIPLVFNLIWDMMPEKLCAKLNWTNNFLLPVTSVLVGLVIVEIASSQYLLLTDPCKKNLVANSLDRSYWYYISFRKSDGSELAINSYGFIGPEPNVNYSGTRMLLIGDSMPAANMNSVNINFPMIAQAIYEDEGLKRQIEILNASFAGYSLEQIMRYYAEKLKGLQHNILILSFYVNDINRELRYSKNNRLYTPSWPEWMQDTYYRCFLWRLLLNQIGFRDETFLVYTKQQSYEDAFPSALKVLDELHVLTQSRGSKFAIFNIPRLRRGVLTETSSYQFLEMNHYIENWCSKNKVAYYDVLPSLVGKDTKQLFISDTDPHFSDFGHKVVGIQLKNFIDALISTDHIKVNRNFN